MSRTLFVVLLLATGAIAVAGWYGWQSWFAPAGVDDRYLSALARRGDLEDTVTATGTLQPKDYVDVGTQVSGQLKKLHVEIGSTVKSGGLLAEIDPTVYVTKVDATNAQLRNQQAQLADRESQLALARLQYERQLGMMAEDATTADALQSAEANLKSVTAQIEALKALIQQTQSSLRGDEANLNYTKIYAPMAGTVVSQAAKQGQTLNANQQAPVVLRIADLSTMTVQTSVSEADVSKLRIGMEVYFTTLGGQSRRWYGKLAQVNPTPQVQNNVVLYDSLFDVPNPSGELMTQMTAQVFFVAAAAKDAVYVPISALRPVAGEGRLRRQARAGGQSVAGKVGDAQDNAAGSGSRPAAQDGARPSGGKGGAGRSGGALPVGVDPRVIFASGNATLSVLGENGELEERAVKIGVMTRVSVQILSGVEAGERVVVGTRQPGAKSTTAAPMRMPRL